MNNRDGPCRAAQTGFVGKNIVGIWIPIGVGA